MFSNIPYLFCQERSQYEEEKLERESAELERIRELEMVIVEKDRLVDEVKKNAQREIADLNEVLEENKRFLCFFIFSLYVLYGAYRQRNRGLWGVWSFFPQLFANVEKHPANVVICSLLEDRVIKVKEWPSSFVWKQVKFSMRCIFLS